MTTETRTPAEIEREIERHRSELTANLDQLQQKFSVDGVMREATHQLREHGSEIGQSVTRTLRENPIPAALIAVGLGWMMFGKKSTGRQVVVREEYTPAAVQQTPPAQALGTPPSDRHQGTGRDLPSWAQDESWDEADD